MDTFAFLREINKGSEKNRSQLVQKNVLAKYDPLVGRMCSSNGETAPEISKKERNT